MAVIKEIKQSKDIWIGNKLSPVAIVVFNDYESSACAVLNEMLQQVLPAFEGVVKINFRHFPLANRHQKAMKAAEAAVAAAQEDLFWPMHNILFENRKKLGIISLKSYAKEIGTTNKKFLDQLVNGVYAWQVREDLVEGISRGVRDVPTIFINGKLYEDELEINSFTEAINRLLSS